MLFRKPHAFISGIARSDSHRPQVAAGALRTASRLVADWAQAEGSKKKEGAVARLTKTRETVDAVPEERSLYPRVRLQALAERKLRQPIYAEGTPIDEGGSGVVKLTPPEGINRSVETSAQASVIEGAPQYVADEVTGFLSKVEAQVEHARFLRNQDIPFPDHPDTLVPTFRRIKKHTQMEVVKADPDYPTFPCLNSFVALPPPAMHPWVKNTPIGPFITHGDGQIGVVGSGEVGFEDGEDMYSERRRRGGWRGLRHHSPLRKRLPQQNGTVHQSVVVKRSVALTGRGVFATQDIKAGETIMIVQDTAQSLGVKGELERLEDMCADVLLSCYEGDADQRAFLHEWILTGQPSSLLEHWPVASTGRVLDAIGGTAVLDVLELHTIHVARLAAIMDLNSFLVENFYAERKGMAYFPEAGFLNHSCEPNATYQIMPEHTFRGSDYFVDELTATRTQQEVELSPVATPMSSVVVTPEVISTSSVGVNAADTHIGAPTQAPPTTAQDGSLSTRYLSQCLGQRLDRSRPLPCLTEASAPTYLFCCRAERDIKAGEEVLISYVPQFWSFDNRQYVLHDRYYFWCKCPKCSPTLDSRYARIPKFTVGVVICVVLMQMLLLYTRSSFEIANEEAEWWRHNLSDEERAELQAQGIDVDQYDPNTLYEKRTKRQQRLADFIAAAKREEKNGMGGGILQIGSDDSKDPYPTSMRI